MSVRVSHRSSVNIKKIRSFASFMLVSTPALSNMSTASFGLRLGLTKVGHRSSDADDSPVAGSSDRQDPHPTDDWPVWCRVSTALCRTCSCSTSTCRRGASDSSGQQGSDQATRPHDQNLRVASTPAISPTANEDGFDSNHGRGTSTSKSLAVSQKVTNQKTDVILSPEETAGLVAGSIFVAGLGLFAWIIASYVDAGQRQADRGDDLNIIRDVKLLGTPIPLLNFNKEEADEMSVPTPIVKTPKGYYNY